LLNALLNCSTSNITLYLFLFTVVLVLVSDSTSSTIEVITTVFLLNTLLIGNTVADFLTLLNVCLNLFNFSRSIWLPSCCNYSIVSSAPHTPYLNYLNWMLIQFHINGCINLRNRYLIVILYKLSHHRQYHVIFIYLNLLLNVS